MSTMKRLNDRAAQQKEAENAMPGGYESRYADDIANTLTAIGDKNAKGFSFTGSDSGYQDALARLNSNAQAGADAAAATAQALSGGYGAQWADSAANQAAAAQTGNTASLMANARADALSQWQRELSGQNSLLDTLLGQNALERSEYDADYANAADWRNYLQGRTAQARQENSDFMSNVWNVLKAVGSAALQGYDAYKGYRQQDWENAFAERQYNDSLSRNQLSDQMAALQQATAYRQAGFDDAAKQVLTKYGLDENMLDAWQGISQVNQDKMGYLATAAGLAGSGYDTAAKNYLGLAGMDTGSIDYSPTLNQRSLSQLAGQLAVQSQYKTTGTGSSGRSSSGSGKNSNQNTNKQSSKADGYTQPQLNTMFKEYSSMKPSDQRYSYYTDTLADAGRISRLSGVGNPGKANGTAYEQAMYQARQMANSGSSQNQIATALVNTGLSNDQITAIMNQIDYEWRGTK